MLQILVTQTCNNACDFCATESPLVKANFLPKDKILSFVFESFENHPDAMWDRRIVFTGGEPTLHPDLLGIIKVIKSRYEVEIGIQSNCRNMSDKRLAFALKEAGVDWVLASIYGPNAELHDQITNRKGGFEQTVLGIKNLIENNVFVEVRTVLHRNTVENLADYVKLAISEFEGIWRLSVVTLDYTGTVPNHLENVSVDLSTVIQSYIEAVELAKASDIPLRMICCPLCYLPIEYWDLVIPAESVPKHFLSWEKETHDNSKKNFGYHDDCDNCLVQGLCPGVARTYLEYFPDTNVYPVEDVDLRLRDNGRLKVYNDKLIIGCSRTGNWFFTDQAHLIQPILNNALHTLPFRTKRELLRQELASPLGFGRHSDIIKKREKGRGIASRTDKMDWDFFIFNVTDTCNLRCKYCYSLPDDKDSQASISIYNVLKQMVDIAPNRLVVEFHGGEPLIAFSELSDAVYRIESYVAKKNKQIAFLIVTNGTLVDKKIAEFFSYHNFSVIVSLDGPKNVHNRYRVNAQSHGSYDKVMAGIKHLQDAGVPFAVNSVVSSDSVNNIIETFEHHLAQGIYRMKFIPVVPSNKFEKKLARRNFNDAMIEIANRIMEMSDPNTSPPEVLNLSYALLALLGVKGRYLCMDLPCGAATKMLTVNRDGQVYGCHKLATFPEHSLGNILDEDIKTKIPNSPSLKAMLESKNVNKGECESCEFYGLCGGMCYADYWMTQNSTIGEIEHNFDCMYDLFWYFVDIAEQSPEQLSQFLLNPRVGDLV